MKTNQNPVRCLGIMILAVATLDGVQLTTRRFQAIVDTDGEPIVTSMLLRLPMKTYGEGGTPLDALVNDSRLDDRERAMVTYLNSIRTSNAAAFHALEYVPPPITKHEVFAVRVDLTFDQIAAIMGKIFDYFRNVRLECRIPMEAGDLFIWKAETADGWLRKGFLVLTVDGKLRIDFASSNYPLEAYVETSLDRSTMDSLERMAVRPSEKREFSLDLDGRGAGLEFNGQYLKAEICDRSATLPQAARVLCAAARKLRDGDEDGYLALLWPPSRERMEKWFQRYGFEQWRKRQPEAEYIRFILDADPVFMVFLLTAAERTWPDNLGYHRYVFRSSGGLEIGNVFLVSLFDEMLEKERTNLIKFLKRGDATPRGTQSGGEPKPVK